MEKDAKHIEKLYNKILNFTTKKMTHTQLNGD